MHKLLIVLLSLLLFVALGYWCINRTTVPEVEDDIKTRVTQSLLAKQLPSIQVEVDGRDLTLTGTVLNNQQRITAEKAANVHGVRTIENQIMLDSSLLTPDKNQGYFLIVNRDKDNRVNIQGHVQNSLSHHNLVSYVMNSFKATEVVDQLIEKQSPPENWIEVSKAGIDILKQLEAGRLTLSDRKLILSGESNGHILQKDIDQMLISSLPNGFQRNLDITIMEQENTSDPLNSECYKKLNETIASFNVTFKTNSTNITKTSSTWLNKLAKIKYGCPAQVFNINGHTDSKGDAQLNLILSEKRAVAVRNYLISKGVTNKKIIAKGFGEAFPIAKNNTLSGQNKNRRIEIVVRDPKQ